MKESIKIQTVQDQKYISTTFFKCIHPFLSKRQQLGHCFAAWVFCFLIIFFIKEVSDVSHNYLCSMTKQCQRGTFTVQGNKKSCDRWHGPHRALISISENSWDSLNPQRNSGKLTGITSLPSTPHAHIRKPHTKYYYMLNADSCLL